MVGRQWSRNGLAAPTVVELELQGTSLGGAPPSMMINNTRRIIDNTDIFHMILQAILIWSNYVMCTTSQMITNGRGALGLLMQGDYAHAGTPRR